MNRRPDWVEKARQLVFGPDQISVAIIARELKVEVDVVLDALGIDREAYHRAKAREQECQENRFERRWRARWMRQRAAASRLRCELQIRLQRERAFDGAVRRFHTLWHAAELLENAGRAA